MNTKITVIDTCSTVIDTIHRTRFFHIFSVCLSQYWLQALDKNFPTLSTVDVYPDNCLENNSKRIKSNQNHRTRLNSSEYLLSWQRLNGDSSFQSLRFVSLYMTVLLNGHVRAVHKSRGGGARASRDSSTWPPARLGHAQLARLSVRPRPARRMFGVWGIDLPLSLPGSQRARVDVYYPFARPRLRRDSSSSSSAVL